MAVSVRLDFTPPSIPDIIKLHVEEAPASAGVFAEIDSTTQVGSYPNYISYYTTQVASDLNYWFRIRWETSDGVFSPYSSTLQGGTKTLVQDIVDRVLLRNPNLNEIIVTQEAQAVVAQYFGTDDPNSIPVTGASYVEIRGMTNMTLARSLVATFFATGGTVSGFTAGLVSIKAGTTGGTDPSKAIEALVKSANIDLGTGESFVLLLKQIGNGADRPYCCPPSGALTGVDLTRSAAMIDYGEVNA